MDEGPLPDFTCPDCGAGVALEWKACPHCGVALLPPEAPAAPAPAKVVTLAPPAKAPAASIAKVARAAPAPLPPPPPPPAKARPPPAPFDGLDPLGHDIAAASAQRSTAPPTFPRRPARPRAGRGLRRAGAATAAIGAAGALVALNWDTWVLGAPSNNIGTLQLVMTGAMAAPAAVGAILLPRGRRKRKPTAAAA